MQAQDGLIKVDCSSECGEGGHGNFTSRMNFIADRKELNNIVASGVTRDLKFKNKSKANAKDNPNLDVESETFNSENLDIVADLGS